MTFGAVTKHASNIINEGAVSAVSSIQSNTNPEFCVFESETQGPASSSGNQMEVLNPDQKHSKVSSISNQSLSAHEQVPRYYFAAAVKFKQYDLKQYATEPYFTKSKKIIKCEYFELLSSVIDDILKFRSLPKLDESCDRAVIQGKPLSKGGIGWNLAEYLRMLPPQAIQHQLLPNEMDLLALFNVHYCNENEKIVTLQGVKYLIPRCEFIVSEYSNFVNHLLDIDCKLSVGPSGQNNEFSQFDLILMDPPWFNSSVNSNYDQLDCFELLKLPIEKILEEQGFLCIWVTNNSKYQNFVKKWFKKLGMKHKVLIWLKVSSDGRPVVPLGNPRRKPYELLFIGSRNDFELKFDVVVGTIGHHSRKPTLDLEELLGKCFMRKMELFARMCREEYLCWGNETIIFNQLDHLTPSDNPATKPHI